MSDMAEGYRMVGSLQKVIDYEWGTDIENVTIQNLIDSVSEISRNGGDCISDRLHDAYAFIDDIFKLGVVCFYDGALCCDADGKVLRPKDLPGERNSSNSISRLSGNTGINMGLQIPNDLLDERHAVWVIPDGLNDTVRIRRTQPRGGILVYFLKFDEEFTEYVENVQLSSMNRELIMHLNKLLRVNLFSDDIGQELWKCIRPSVLVKTIISDMIRAYDIVDLE